MREKSYPDYRVYTDKIEVDLKLSRKEPLKYKITIKFNEIKELEAFDSRGAINVSTKMGFSFTKLKIKGSNQVAKFMKGKIKRPEVVVFAITNPPPRFLHYLLIKGSKLFYFIPLGSQDGVDAVKAFKKYKKIV